MMRSIKEILEKNLTRTFLLRLRADSNGEYIPYCDFRGHPQIVGYKKARECEERKCIHYRLFREPR